jgi:phage tail sheath protein FI
MSFLHGIEFVTGDKISAIRVRNASIIGVVGTATSGPINSPTLVISEKEGKRIFGTNMNCTIPKALDAIFRQGKNVGYVVVINVGTDKSHIRDEQGSLELEDKMTLAHKPLVNGSVSVRSGNDGRPFTENTDYVVDYENGIIWRVAGHILDNEILVTYDYWTGEEVQPDVIVGAKAGDGKNTGIYALLNAESVLGYKPKLLIAPNYSATETVVEALLEVAAALKGRAIIDCGDGLTKEEAKTYRDNFDDVNLTICYPSALVLPEGSEKMIEYDASAFVAGVWSRVINEYGYWYSPSNHKVIGIQELQRPIDYIPDSSLCTASYLNENGITTFVKRDNAYYVWGNLSATSDEDYKFACVQMTRQVHQEALLASIIRMLDRPINKAWLENIQDTVQRFLNGEVGKGAIVYGKVELPAGENPPEEIMQGHITALWDWTPCYPAQRLTFKETINIDELARLFES